MWKSSKPKRTFRLAGAAALLLGTVSGAHAGWTIFSSAPPDPELVQLEPGELSYRPAGDFTRDGRPIDAPLVTVRITQPLAIMKTQVSAADYERCVSDGVCQMHGKSIAREDLPVVGVSWLDATTYAAWLSAKTGHNWRLPTDEEWSFAAGSRLQDEVVTDRATSDPSDRWLEKYDQEARRKGQVEKAPRPFGSFGENEHGLLDLAGNVWEWTNTCFVRQALDEADRPQGKSTVNCGVRVVAGAHRGYVSDFIRDARSGGCSVGTPPANLGFRLVRDNEIGPTSSLPQLLTRVAAGTGGAESGTWDKRSRLD